MTGKNPGKHGCFDFLDNIPNRFIYEKPLISSKSIDGKTLWEILSENGKKVGVIGFPMTYPPSPVNGFMVSGLLTPNKNADFTYPKSLKEDLLSYLGDFYFDIRWDKYKPNKEKKFLKELYNSYENRKKSLFYLMEKFNWDVFAVLFMEADRLQHFFWKYKDKTHPAYSFYKYLLFGKEIEKYYIKLDKLIGEIISKLRNNFTLFVISDHGAGSLKKRIYLNNYLEKLGYLKTILDEKLSSQEESYFDFIKKFNYAKIEKFFECSSETEGIGNFTINGEYRDVLLQHPPSIISYKLTIPKNASIKFGCSLAPYVWDKIGEGVLFKIEIEDCKGKELIFSKYINPKQNIEDRKWHNFSINLYKFEKKEVKINFITELGPNKNGLYCQGGWSEPIITYSGKKGIFKLISKNEHIKRKRIDWERTKAFSSGESELGIYINLKGREPKGIVQLNEYEKLRERIIDELLKLEDEETKEKVIEWALKREDIYKGPNISKAPDILFMPKKMEYGITSELKNDVIFEDSIWRSGTHRMDGILFAFGTHIKENASPYEPSIMDIAPTILNIMGISVPKDIDGRILKEILK